MEKENAQGLESVKGKERTIGGKIKTNMSRIVLVLVVCYTTQTTILILPKGEAPGRVL